jgi:hypothetical protein
LKYYHYDHKQFVGFSFRPFELLVKAQVERDLNAMHQNALAEEQAKTKTKQLDLDRFGFFHRQPLITFGLGMAVVIFGPTIYKAIIDVKNGKTNAQPAATK